MVKDGLATSRRALLSGLAAIPITTLPAAPSWGTAILALSDIETDEPILLRRSKQGRSDSEFRYHNAEGFFANLEEGHRHCNHALLYNVGIVLQLALSSHLLDVGFDDRWCARHVGLNIAKSLAYANAIGLGHDCADLERLAAFLSPYCKWRHVDEVPPDCPFPDHEIRRLTRALLERVHQVTGHPRPRGWRRLFT